MPNVKNYFEPPGPDGDNKLVLTGTVDGLGAVELGAETIFNTGGDPQMVMAIKDGNVSEASLVMANEGFGSDPSQHANTIFGCFNGYQISSGNRNSTLGLKAAQNLTVGEQNTAIGFASGATQSTGEKNLCVGGLSGQLMTTGSRNTLIGHGASTGSIRNDCLSLGENSQAPALNFGMNIGDFLYGKMNSAQLIIGTSPTLDGDSFDKSAQVELHDTDKALLLNRVSVDTAITTKSVGMIWYNTTDNKFRVQLQVGTRQLSTEAVS